MNFGPLNQAGGWRRLNVAVTRARATGRGRQLDHRRRHRRDPQRRRAPLQALPRLRRAGRRRARCRHRRRGRRTTESPFEDAVLDTLRVLGLRRGAPGRCTPATASTSASATPSSPGRTLLGIECDGAMYHSRGRPATATGCARRCSRVWAGRCTASGARPGTATEKWSSNVCGRRLTTQSQDERSHRVLSLSDRRRSISSKSSISALHRRGRLRIASRLRWFGAVARSPMSRQGRRSKNSREIVGVEGPVSFEACSQRIKAAFGARDLSGPPRSGSTATCSRWCDAGTSSRSKWGSCSTRTVRAAGQNTRPRRSRESTNARACVVARGRARCESFRGGLAASSRRKSC